MSSPNELKAQLARTEQALLEAEREIDRQRKAAAEAADAAEENIPEGAKALIAAVSKVDLPAFWDADPVLWFHQCESAFRRAGTVSSGVKFDHVVGKLPFLSPAAPSCCPSTSRTRTPTSGSRTTSAGTIASRSGSKGTPYWTTPPSAITARLSCYKTCEPSCLTKRLKASFSSASSSNVCQQPCPTPSWPPGWRI